MGTYRFVVQFPEPLDGQEGPHEEAVHDEQLDEAASLGLEGVDHDVVGGSDALLVSIEFTLIISFDRGKISPKVLECKSVYLAKPFIRDQKKFTGGWG